MTLASLKRLNLGLWAGDISRDKWVRLGKRLISNQYRSLIILSERSRGDKNVRRCWMISSSSVDLLELRKSDKSRNRILTSSLLDNWMIYSISSGSFFSFFRGNSTSRPSQVIAPPIFRVAIYVNNHCFSCTFSSGR